MLRNLCVKEASTRLVIKASLAGTQSEAHKLSHYTGNTPVSKY
jgi:hypothetical protein